MQHGTGYHCNGTGNIVFLYSEQITGKAGQRRHSEQQEAKTPIPAGIKKIACAGKQHNPLSFPPEYIPVQKKDNGKKERKPECRKKHLQKKPSIHALYGSVAGLFAIFR